MDSTRNMHERIACINKALILLQNSWAIACRRIIIASCIGNCCTSSGASIRKSLVCKEDPILFLRKTWGRSRMPKSWEPNWHIPGNSIKAASLLRISNITQITNSIGAITVADEMRISRNLICHNIPNIWTQFKAITINRQHKLYKSVEEYLTDYYLGTYQKVIDYWIEQFKGALISAVK